MIRYYIVEKDDGGIVHAKTNGLTNMKKKLIRMFRNGFCDCFLMTEEEYRKYKEVN